MNEDAVPQYIGECPVYFFRADVYISPGAGSSMWQGVIFSGGLNSGGLNIQGLTQHWLAL